MKARLYSMKHWFAPLKLTMIMLLASSFFIASVSAEQKKQLGSWDVHYIAMPSTLIDPAIAKSYQLERTKYQGLINISVLNSRDQTAQKVTISGVGKNLLGQQKDLVFREVVEGKAIYYLAQLPYRNEERVSFTLQITQGEQRQQLQFDHTFYVD